MRDTIDNSLKRCLASMMNNDYDATLAECDVAAAEYGHHWELDFFRGFALSGKGQLLEAEETWCRADTHYDPSFPLPPSQLASCALSIFAAGQQDYPNALRYINRFLFAGNSDDIFGLYVRGRLTADFAEGMDDENLRMDHFKAATQDLQQAYKLLHRLPNEQFYLFKSMRDFVEPHYDETLNLFKDVANTIFISNFLFHFPMIVNAQDTPVLESKDLFGTLMPADLMRIEIGVALMDTLIEIDGSLVEILTLLKDLYAVTYRNGEFHWHTFILLLIVQTHIDMHYVDSSDNYYLEMAESHLADLLRHAYEHQTYDSFAEQIKAIETKLEKLRK